MDAGSTFNPFDEFLVISCALDEAAGGATENKKIRLGGNQQPAGLDNQISQG